MNTNSRQWSVETLKVFNFPPLIIMDVALYQSTNPQTVDEISSNQFQSLLQVLVFFKSRPDVITPENLHKDVFVSSMWDSPVSALYHALQKVYAPLLLKDAKWSNEFDPKLQVR